MWTIVYIAQEKELAERIKSALTEKNILFKVREMGKENTDDVCYEFLVCETEIEQAHSVIIEIGF